jgi:hypothetical protein
MEEMTKPDRLFFFFWLIASLGRLFLTRKLGSPN